MKIDLAYIGHELLRKKATSVTSIEQPIRELIGHLKDTVIAYNGFGLAAPQVGVSLAIIVTRFPEFDVEGTPVPGSPKIFINPKISEPSTETWVEEEGCLSIPKVYGHVRRPVAITVTYRDEHDETHTERLSGWPAKILMHENDHLNGVLFIDRLDSREKREIGNDLELLKKHYKNHNEHLKGPKV